MLTTLVSFQKVWDLLTQTNKHKEEDSVSDTNIGLKQPNKIYMHILSINL